MAHAAFLVVLLAAASPAPVAAPPTIYRVELAGTQSAWAIGKPEPNRNLLLFRHYPDGALMSVRAKDVRRVVAWREPAAASGPSRELKPGQAVEIGMTGGGSAAPTAGKTAGGRVAAPTTAPFNPSRAYNPSWDSKLVPGSTMPYPASPNDYAEGKTLAFPPASSVQAAPGEVPRSPEPKP